MVLVLYLLFRRRWLQNPLLLVASYVFYGFWDWRFLFLIGISTIVDYLVGRGLDATDDVVGRRLLLGLSIAVNLGILGFFKYFGFFAESLTALFNTVGLHADPVTLNIVLPVGISFYTFQTLGYSIDVYRRKTPAERWFFDFALYVSYFPQLVAGPIERSSRLLPQFQKERSVTWNQIRGGLWLIAFGLFKKVVVADNMARLVDPVYAETWALDGWGAWIAFYAFALQIYGDFSGYTDIARGVSKLFGIELALNFRRPYFSVDPRDFWQRWHISLSSWLRDYLYIPLGGNRGGPVLTQVNLMITMLLGGLWHGASWMFVIWGAIHGGVLAAHRAIFGTRPPPLGRFGAVLAGIALFHFVCIAWVFFRAPSLWSAGKVLVGMTQFGPPEPQVWVNLAFFAVCAALLLFLDIWAEVWERFVGRDADWEFIWSAPGFVRGLVYTALLLQLAIAGAPAGAEFLYFQF